MKRSKPHGRDRGKASDVECYSADTADPVAISDELLHGKGAVLISGLFIPDQIAEARAIVDAIQRATHAIVFGAKPVVGATVAPAVNAR